MTDPDPRAAAPQSPDLPWSAGWPVRALPTRKPLRFDLVADAGARARIAADLGLIDLPALRFRGEVRPLGRTDVELAGRIEARAVQPCAVTLAPVETFVDEPVLRRYLKDWTAPEGDEAEIPEDVSDEPLPEVIDAGAAAVEALALALPDWPRAPGADLGEAAFAPPGAAPLRPEDLRPFAGLAALRDRLSGGEEPDDGGPGSSGA